MIKVGVIGLGHNGIAHIEAHKRLNKSEITAICDVNPKRLEEVAKKFDIKKVYQSAEELCASTDVDAVSINTGDQYHIEPFLLAIKHKKHVLVEKPLANNLKQAKKMLKAARKADPKLKIAVGYILRFNKVFEYVHDICRSSKLGKIFYMEADYVHNLIYQKNETDPKTGANWKLDNEKPMVGGGSHPLDLLRWFSGAEVVEVSGYSNHMAYPELKADDCQVALFKFDSGAVAKVAAVYGPRTEMPKFYNLRVYGTNGTIFDDKIAISKDADDVHPEFQQIPVDYVPGHAYEPEIEDWLDAIEKDRKPRCEIFDGGNSTVAALIGYEALLAKKSFRVPIYKSK